MRRFLRRAALLAAAVPVFCAFPALSVRPESADRQIVGAVPVEVASSDDIGPADPGLPFERAVLLLQPRDPGGLETFLAAQLDPASADFHRWLTPEEFGSRFGAAPGDLGAVAAWAQEQGLTIEAVTAGRTVLLLSGLVRDFERAFATEIRQVSYAGRPYLTNIVAPSVPAALARSVAGLVSLHSFERRRPLSRTRLANTSGGHSLAPADFSTIYNLDPLIGSGLNGSGQKIAVIAQSNINVDDVRFFRQYFGLPAKDPTIVLNGPDPGVVTDDETEADLDTEWSGGVAPGATVLVVVSKTTLPTYGVDLSVLYTVDNNVADVITYSYGACEDSFAPEDTAFYTNVWAQAAAEGISVFVASGDSGVAGCDDSTATSGSIASVNGLGSSPYSTCVGGTQFAEGATPSAYWASSNDPATRKSAKGPIPETTWNESAAVPGGSGLFASGGGFSKLFPQPSWQSGPGVPASGQRAVPDISVNSAQHTAYLLFQGHTSGSNGLYGAYGTSTSAPAFAGIAAVLNQKTGGRQGNLNPNLYALARAQFGGSGPAVFRDVTTGSNTVPGLTGYAAGPGYDLATGLGSVDAAALANAWGAASPVGGSSSGTPADFTVGAFPAILTLAAGGAATASITAGSAQEPVLSLAASGLPAGLTATFSPSKQSGPGDTGYTSPGVPATLTLKASASPAPSPGTYAVTITALSATRTRKITILVTIGGGGAAPTGPELQAPVILDVFGKAGSHFTSDFVAVNRDTTDATLLLRYSATPGTPGAGGPVIAASLPAGRQLYIPDVIAFLAANGYVLPSDGSAKLGTLYALFSGVSDATLVYAGSRNSTPNPNAAVGGSFGAFSGSVASGSGVSGETWVYGLTENASFRSNLGLVHSPATSSYAAQAPVGVEVQLYDGDSGAPAGAPLTHTLQPGEFFQYNSVLAQRSVTNGYARIRRTSGTDRLIAYGVVNDGGSAGGGTSDASFIASGGTEGFVPIVLDVPASSHFFTELTLINTGTATSTVSLTYTPSTVFSTAGGGTVTTTLAAGRQLKVPNAIAFLRGLGLAIPSDGSAQGGTLVIQGAVAQGRTYNPNADTSVGGTFGFSYPAVSSAGRATSGAWVYGLRQDDQFRSNLAIADARVGSSTTVEYDVDLFDADSGSQAPVTTLPVFLAGGQWTQINAVLGQAGIRNGYAHVRAAQVSSFVTYGVSNDGATPGTKTSDGSYLGMVVD
jgi:pseudomonalisin